MTRRVLPVVLQTSAVCALALAPIAAAQTPGACEPGQATGTLDASDVQAVFPNTGTLFYPGKRVDGSIVRYRVPQATGISPIHAASVWIGGTVDEQFRVAGTTYALGEAGNDLFEFWPGPLGSGATPPADCSAFDRVWVVSQQDLADYESGGTPTPDLRDWPATLGAPVTDGDGVPDNYSLAGGDRPLVYGTQTAFWVMNDVGGEHRTTGSAPLGVEVAVTAFTVASGTLALHQATFLRYRVTNRNTAAIQDARFTFWADADVGYAGDDAVAADTSRSMAVAYNSDDFDEGSGYGYGASPAALGVDVLGGDTSQGRPRVAAFLYASGGDFGRQDPQDAIGYDRVMHGLWPDGTPVTAFGNGYQQGGTATPFAFPGDPVAQAFWSEENTGDGRSREGDRRFSLTSEIGALAPGASATIDFGLLFAQGTSRLDAVTRLRAASDLIQSRYDDGSLFAPAPPPTGSAPATPALAAPADEAGPLMDEVALEWTAVAGATDYFYQTSERPDFEDALTRSASGAGAVYPPGEPSTSIPAAFSPSEPTVYWRVRARQGPFLSEWSEARSFDYSIPAFVPEAYAVEIVGPGGVDPCRADAVSRTGCPEPGADLRPMAPGNLVYSSFTGSLNSTGAYFLTWYASSGYVGGSVDNSLPSFAPNDFEIRVVPEAEGSYGYYGFESDRVARVPFQIWDVGNVTPGTPNDPADDVQMVPVLFSDAGTVEAECAFGFTNPPRPYTSSTAMTTPRIYAYYPVGNDYPAYHALAEAAVAADPDGCPVVSKSGPVSNAIDYNRGRPLERDVFVQHGETTSMTDLEGAVIRYYTAAGSTPAEPADPEPGTLDLAAPFPNPATTRATVRYTTGAPGPVRVVLLDVLGRQLAVLADGDRRPGTHRAELDAGRLAAGVYALVLEAGGQRRVRMLTVAR